MAVILALDPGTKNYGYAVWETEGGHAHLRQSGRIFTTIIALNRGLRQQARQHSITLNQLINDFKVTHLIAERFQSRRMGGTTIEAVNMMLGAISEICVEKNVYFKFIPASQWKLAVGRVKEDYLTEEYQLAKEFGITPHTVDAVMIGIYGLGTMKGVDPFQGKLYKGRVADLVMKSGGIVDIGDPKGFLEFKPPKKKRKRKRKG